MPVQARTGGLDRLGRFERLPLPSSTGGFGESRSAICASLVAHDAFAGSRSARSLRYEYGNSWVVIYRKRCASLPRAVSPCRASTNAPVHRWLSTLIMRSEEVLDVTGSVYVYIDASMSGQSCRYY